MDTENMIDITGSNLVDVVRAAYDLSSPQGLGFIHFEAGGGLTDDEVDSLIITDNDRIAVSLDYVKGRACKLTVFKDEDKLFIDNCWYDHSESALLELVDRIAV